MLNMLLLFIAENLASDPKGGIFDFNATLPFMMLQFILLMLALNYIFYKPVANVLDERADYIRNTLTTASAYLLQADELTKKYEQALATSRKRAQDMIRQSQQEAQRIVAINIKQAQQEAEKLVEEASDQLNTQKEEALKTLEDQVNVLSDHIKTKLLSRQLF